MSWQENRRRKRRWYRYYREMCEVIRNTIIMTPGTEPMNVSAIALAVFQFNDRRRLHRRKFIAGSAFESLKLAVQDTGLDKMYVRPSQPPRGEDELDKLARSLAEPRSFILPDMSGRFISGTPRQGPLDPREPTQPADRTFMAGSQTVPIRKPDVPF